MIKKKNHITANHRYHILGNGRDGGPTSFEDECLTTVLAGTRCIVGNVVHLHFQPLWNRTVAYTKMADVLPYMEYQSTAAATHTVVKHID